MTQKPKNKIQPSTLCIIIDEKKSQILLALKKRGFGVNLWNAPGGKVHPNETIVEAAIRETEEEIGLKTTNIIPIGDIMFHFPTGLGLTDYHVHFFRALTWEGEPIETEEMLPKWFDFDKIPYNKMWEDDKYWLLLVLQNKKITGVCNFDKNNHIISHQIAAI